MSTRSEKFHAEEQRQNSVKKSASKKTAKKAKASKPGVAAKDRTRAKKTAGKKASYALEEVKPNARPSRKSTRKSANRSKPDTAFNLTEQLKKGSPETRFAKSKARTTRVRGKATKTR